ncbi:MAG: radical SAM protein [Acidobacteriota bacterium]|nr:radical SAM protein [Acidobacteriota bacterium]
MEDYKFSIYNYLFDVTGKRYVYNTLSTALAQIDDQTALAMATNDISLVDTQYCEPLKSQHFIVEFGMNEAHEYLYFYNRTRFAKTSGTLAITLIPTYNCNLACPYCIQGQSKTNKSMSDEDLIDILAFTESKLIQSQKDTVPIAKIRASLYGGEPMLHKNVLVSFANGMYAIAQKYNCEIIYSMTSNMTLLDDDMLDLMRKYRINTQVSIDGTKEQHDMRRITKNGAGTYNIIMKNLQRLNNTGLKDCVIIRLNIDKNNIDEADGIMRSIRDYSNDVYFGFLENYNTFNDAFSEKCISRESYTQIVSNKFDAIALKYGFTPNTHFGKQAPCSLIMQAFFCKFFKKIYEPVSICK